MFRNIKNILSSIVREDGMAILGFMQLKTFLKGSNLNNVPLQRIDMKF